MLESYKSLEPIVYKQMKNALNGNLSHAYLFDINGNVYAEKMIMSFIKAILCKEHMNMDEYLECHKCKRIDDGNYPELKKIYPDGQYIKKEEIDNLQKDFSTKSIESDKKAYIIYEAEKLNSNAANGLLKFLEEPSDGIVAILLTRNASQVLSTITSRCQTIRFNNSKVEDYILVNKIEKNITLHKLSFSIFNEQKDEEYLNTFIDSLLKFWKKYEENGKKTILYEKEYYLDIFKVKDEVINFIKCSILLYRDIINFKLGRNVLYFNDNLDALKKISENNDIDRLLFKLDILLKKEKLIRRNVNLNMFIDGIIIDMEE